MRLGPTELDEMADTKKTNVKSVRVKRGKSAVTKTPRRTQPKVEAAAEVMSDLEVEMAVESAIRQLVGKMLDEGVKGTLTDLVRLLQMRKEFVEQRPTRIEAGWVQEAEWEKKLADVL